MGLLNFLSNADSRRAVKKLEKLAFKVEEAEPYYAAMSDETGSPRGKRSTIYW